MEITKPLRRLRCVRVVQAKCNIPNTSIVQDTHPTFYLGDRNANKEMKINAERIEVNEDLKSVRRKLKLEKQTAISKIHPELCNPLYLPKYSNRAKNSRVKVHFSVGVASAHRISSSSQQSAYSPNCFKQTRHAHDSRCKH